MKRRWFSVLAGMALCLGLAAGSFGADLHVVDLRCEYRENPPGIDVTSPRLSWRLEAGTERGIRQTAYQVLVASSEDLLSRGRGDLWDSGKVASDQSIQVEYAGKPLESRMRCYWKVRSWLVRHSSLSDGGTPAGEAWSKPASWAMGLLKPEDWSAGWIGYDAATKVAPDEARDSRLFSLAGLRWQQAPNGKAGAAACFRKRFEIPQDRKVARATLVLYAYHYCEAALNGAAIGSGAHWERTARLDATKVLRGGTNLLTLVASHTDPYPPAVIGKLVVQFESGGDLVVPVDGTWKVSQSPDAGWQEPGFDDAAWAGAQEGGYKFGVVADVERVPAPHLRRSFGVAQGVRRATVYVTALGAYELHLNGKRVGNDVLTPGWTEFRKRVHYQTYDVTGVVRKGENAIGAILGDGWYASNLAHLCRRKFYGGNPRLLAQLVIELDDGSTQVVATDASWKASYGPIRHADLLIGCEYDSRLEMPGWDKAGFDDAAWQQVEASAPGEGGADVTAAVAAAIRDGRISLRAENDALGGDPAEGQVKALAVEYQAGGKQAKTTVPEHGTLELAGADLKVLKAVYGQYGQRSAGAAGLRVQASVAEPSRVIEELPAVAVTEPRPGCWTFDLGQNMVGWVRLKVRGEKGQRITVRHGEMINPDGTIYTAALRSCPATDFFTLSGGGQVLEPYFTFHGFRYVEVRGLTSTPGPDAVTGIVVHSALRRTGSFECTHPLANRLYSNIIWGQKGNYLEVPTDCPQRDERMGWTGDTQFFAPTAAYNFDVAAFFTRWLQSCEDDQFGDGSLPHVVPDIMGAGGAMAWGCAGLLCTYNVYRAYGDTRVVADRFGMMERYMKWLAGRTKDGITRVGGFGDWLNAGGGASAEAMDTAYHAAEARMMAEMAAAIGRGEDADRYAKLHEELKVAFVREFVQPDGSLKGCGQTGYALAFTMDLLPADMREKAAGKFVEQIQRFDWHLATGFIGTPRLLPALSLAGRDDVAYRLLLTDTYPSWLFPVKNGATTMWERWNGWTPDRGFGDIGMNSFNHYAFGAVGEYLYGGVGGIKAASPGYRSIVIKPAVGEGLDGAKTSFDSVYGRIVSNWRRDGKRLSMEVIIPPNATAAVWVPAASPAGVSESGKPADKAPGVRFVRAEGGAAVFEVGSGRYEFVSEDAS
jgi:alpha-L-rhamnosidase